jgi:hypothetical protein
MLELLSYLRGAGSRPFTPHLSGKCEAHPGHRGTIIGAV